MKSYLMRLIGSKETRGVIGLVVAGSLDELWDIVDEWDNPNNYEYAVVQGGGGAFFGFSDRRGMRSEGWLGQFPHDEDEFPDVPQPKNPAIWKTFSQMLTMPFDDWYAARLAGA